MTGGAVELQDPLAINLRWQVAVLLEQLPANSSYSTVLRSCTNRVQLLSTLSDLLSVPALTHKVSTAFRPLLLDLCARWLHNDDRWNEKFEAACLLIGVHLELYPVLTALLRRSGHEGGPLAFVLDESIDTLDANLLHCLLLAYYRLLQVNRTLPHTLLWSVEPLLKLIWTPHPDAGVRFLAIRCYALHVGMVEAERVKLEKRVVGEVSEADCPISYGVNIDESRIGLDGWVMPMKEVERVTTWRNALLDEQNYYIYDENDSRQPIHPAELSPLIVNVYGVLMLRSSATIPQPTGLIETPTSVRALQTLVVHHSLRVPTLLTSASSAGKSLLLSHLASLLHPDAHNQVIPIYLADTSLDPRSLIGSYASSPTRPGSFEWKEGVLVRAMREGKWVVFEDIDRASTEVLGVIKPLVESLGPEKYIGGRAALDIPSRGTVMAEDSFAIYATRSVTPSRNGSFAAPAFYGAHKFYEVIVQPPTSEDLQTIVNTKYTSLAGVPAQGLIRLWEAVRALGTAASVRDVGMRELGKLCARVDYILPSSQPSVDIDVDTEQPMLLPFIFPNPTLREEIYLEARDVFFGAGVTTAAARNHVDAVAAVVAEHLGLSAERRDWLLRDWTPEYEIEKDINGRTTAVRMGRTRLGARTATTHTTPGAARPFAMHRPAVQLLSRIATAVSLNEPVLLTGETGTGKTSAISHLATLLNRQLISLNLSNQTESSDLIGGFKPVDARVPAAELQDRFLELFGDTFSRKKNAKFEESVRKAVQDGKWKRAVGLWREAVKLAREKIQARNQEPTVELGRQQGEAPRKRRKLEQDELNVSEATWETFDRDVQTFNVQHVQGNSKFAFAFTEGLLVKALRSGDWILLDEVNLASAETLESISALLSGPTASITLTEQGSLEPVPRHPDFRLFACMNPATDVGKRDLPPNIRSRFTEIDVPPPDADRETLLSIVSQYVGGCAVGDRGAIMDVAEFYGAVKSLAEERKLADGSNHRPHYNMRTLARALTFTADMASTYSLRRALWEGCLMTFTMVLDEPSAVLVTALAQKHLLAGVRNPRSLLAKEPIPPKDSEAFVKFGPFYLEKGSLPEDPVEHYVMTPSVQTKLINLARIISAKRFPVLIEGPTSSGKTSSIEYLAKRTGHRFVRINNHEHTDIQEYLGTYISDSATGKLVFKDGLLVRALRNGDWIVLDELNLAPTDVLEALNRLLDDNRELVIPETQEVVRPHPHFMLFATQNPSGLYAGRKVLSRAFRNRFLEVHFADVPQDELKDILCDRCRIAPSHGEKIVSVFKELQKRRQSSRVFESKHGFATLRDLFRWAQRDALDYQELAENGYMLLAERARRDDDKAVVKEVIESIMQVRIDETRLYDLHRADLPTYLDCPIPTNSQLAWTSAMRRLFILVSRALRFNEPVLLVGETGCGKTSVCQIYAETLSKTLRTVNCHQNTETADLIGGLRPIRNRVTMEAETMREVELFLSQIGLLGAERSPDTFLHVLNSLLQSTTWDLSQRQNILDLRTKLQRLTAMFEWHDGPLVQAMRAGDAFLLDEISLADDSVLERLNSVLEPERTIVLAEQGGDTDTVSVKADHRFKLVATMNPGGDYGKKELSPALRNRFTEIWVPAITNRQDFEAIMNTLWQHEEFKSLSQPVLDFVEWLCTRAVDRSLFGVRDILSWVQFTNAVYSSSHERLPINNIFHHAAHMTFLDGLASLPHFAGYSRDALRNLKAEAAQKLQGLFPVSNEENDYVPAMDSNEVVQFGSFSVQRGPKDSLSRDFSLDAPTTRDNVMRVVRACQLSRPILLEGSPGVGKTSLVTALANICGYELCRINLSDQTDLMDLFGSDLPVEGGEPGQFAWKDAEFLRALQEGHWVLLDEMNLAPQAILEGLNAVLDHRGTVYIPELGRSFTRHPSFRIFAAQNPLYQGGGRKGLPKSFLNRFTKVYVEELTPDDFLIVCRNLFPDFAVDSLRTMISFTNRLNEEVIVKRSFGREGSPWEFNLRDLIRWGTLLHRSVPQVHPSLFLSAIFLQRFRSDSDRQRARALFRDVCPDDEEQTALNLVISKSSLSLGEFIWPRQGFLTMRRSGRILQAQLYSMEAIGTSLMNSWLVILTGSSGKGKSHLVRTMAHLCGSKLQEISINTATDTTDILGSFEEVDLTYGLIALLGNIVQLYDSVLSHESGSRALSGKQSTKWLAIIRGMVSTNRLTGDLHDTLRATEVLLDELEHTTETFGSQIQTMRGALLEFSAKKATAGKLEWVDGPLVRALIEGHWLVLDGANLCNPSVLDRLNSLCETEGILALNERGPVNGATQIIHPHPNFRLFMCVDPRHGELSRAMRNRGIEVALIDELTAEDHRRAIDHLYLPMKLESDFSKASIFTVELARRGVIRLQKNLHDEYLNWPSARLEGEDSAASWAIDTAPVLSQLSSSTAVDLRAISQFAGRSVKPGYLPLEARFLTNHTSQYIQPVASLIRSLGHSCIFDAIVGIRQSLGRPLHSIDLILCQTLDSETRSTSSDLVNKVNQAIRLFVMLHFDQEEETTMGPNHNKHIPGDTRRSAIEDRKIRACDAVTHLLSDIRLVAQALAGDQDKVINDKNGVKLTIRLLTFGRYLRRAIQSAPLDYSAMQVYIRWILDDLRDSSNNFWAVKSRTESISEIISLTSGLGLHEIWSVLGAMAAPESQTAQIERLQVVVGSAKSQELVRRILEIMAMWSLRRTMSDVEQCGLARVTDEILKGISEHHTDGRDRNLDDIQLAVELNALQHAEPTALREFITSGVQYTVLHRLVPYQQMIWACESGGDPRIYLARLHEQWLKSVWDLGKTGPSQLFQPMLLAGTILDCTSKGKTLGNLTAHEHSLLRRFDLYSDHLFVHEHRRISQISTMLDQALFLIASCFTNAKQGDATIVPDDGSPSSDILSTIHGCNNTAFVEGFERILKPAWVRVQELRQSTGSLDTLELGRCWVALARFILELYVPDAPIDPAATQRCAYRFREEESRTLSAEVELTLQHNLRTTGQASSASLVYLNTLLQDIDVDQPNQLDRLLSERSDVSLLHSYWSEVIQLVSQVTTNARIDSVIQDLQARQSNAVPREQVIQESLMAFVRRLQTVYPDYKDISSPIRLSLLYMKLGLRLVVNSMQQAMLADVSQSELIVALTAFPAVQSADLLRRQHMTNTSVVPTLSVLLAALLGIAAETVKGVAAATYIHTVETLYEQVFGLWLINRAREEEAERDATSLYRRKTTEASAITDSEAEEQDFLSLFPQFEDVFDVTSTQSANTTRPARSALVDATQVVQLAKIHELMFGSRSSEGVLSIFLDHRRVLVSAMLNQGIDNLSEVIDLESRPFQVSLLHDRLSAFRHTRAQDVTYNFYVDANLPEIKKATEVVDNLLDRLSTLVQEWPDQMVLQHLQNRCQLILSFDSSSPIAKLLSALEQLSLQIEDWEMYANRENSLKTFQQSLTTLIVEWRRLELSCWQGLLDSEARTYSSGVSEWWFRLYEACIRGATSSATEDSDKDIDSTTSFLDNLTPLLDEFILASPLGQYEPRLKLLSSFASYVKDLYCDKPEKTRAVLVRIERILRFTERFYQQFLPQITGRLLTQKGEIEKEIRGFIKLASWRDINVHALKQSAQKTHRQLYKNIRKFRDVLRQPVTEHLKSNSDDAVHRPASFHIPAIVNVPAESLIFPSFPADTTSAHLSNLTRTYKVFQRLVTTQLISGLQALATKELDELSVAIATTCQELASTPIPADLDATQRKKLGKSLLNRKKRAWSDLLKELKRIGLATNMRPDVLDRQRNPRWLREQQLLLDTLQDVDSARKEEEYLLRLVNILPQLRASLGYQHQDVGTRELQRGVMLVESGFMLALENRLRIVETSNQYGELSDTVLRLHRVADSQITAHGDAVANQVEAIKDCMLKLELALEELLARLEEHQTHRSGTGLTSDVLDEAKSSVESTKSISAHLTALARKVRSTRTAVLVKDEASVLAQAKEHFSAILMESERWSLSRSPIAYYSKPLRRWLADFVFPDVRVLQQAVHGDSTPALIDSLLVATQAMLPLYPTDKVIDDGSPQAEDDYVKKDTKLMAQFTRALNMGTTLTHANSVLAELTGCSQEETKLRVSRILPFLNVYTELIKQQLLCHVDWSKALFKLDYVTCSVMLRLAKEGFCRPSDATESGTGEGGTELWADGTGLGEGAGDKNVSNDIQDKSQVEGLQGEEDDSNEPVERREDNKAIEMSGEVDGKMQDVEDDGQGEEEEDEDGESDAEPEEEIGDLDASDPSAVDEKLWGDEKGPEDSEKEIGKSNQDHSHGKDDSEMVAKDDSGQDKGKKDKDGVNEEEESREMREEGVEEATEEEGEAQDEQNGAPLDDHIPEADTLDLPDDMNFNTNQDGQDKDMDDDFSMDDAEEVDDLQPQPEEEYAQDMDSQSQPQDDSIDEGEGEAREVQDDAQLDDEAMDKDVEGAVAKPDLHGSTGQDSGTSDNTIGANSGVDEGSADSSGTDTTQAQRHDTPADAGKGSDVDKPGETADREMAEDTQELGGRPESTEVDSGGRRTQANSGTAQPSKLSSSSNPLRSLGDALREISQQMNEILDSAGPSDQQSEDQPNAQSQLEYLHPDETQESMQALGPAMEEEAPKLNQLKFLEDDTSMADAGAPMDGDHEPGPEQSQRPPEPSAMNAEPTSRALGDDTAQALTEAEVRSQHSTRGLDAPGAVPAEQPTGSQSLDEASKEVELKLREWQASGQPSGAAGDIWRLYESLTHDLSYALCEQLRLILEPTMATRLKGDYRSGKRLNMKKIIPYIASEFTKDKIWLRRTRPSQREYQVLIALDDSRSMSESHCVHLAYETLALVSKALSRLEVGDIAIARFGESVDVLHSFDGGPFTDQAGTRLMDAFRFDQKATQVISLVETSLQLLEQARDRRAMSSATASDLWQLEIIISDGICQDHEQLRTVLRRAEEQRVMIVFIILDSLHTRGLNGSDRNQNSILSMSQVVYKNVDGRMDLQVARYLDTFPFEYYVVLRDVEALPDVLAGTLKQFFERIAED